MGRYSDFSKTKKGYPNTIPSCDRKKNYDYLDKRDLTKILAETLVEAQERKAKQKAKLDGKKINPESFYKFSTGK